MSLAEMAATLESAHAQIRIDVQLNKVPGQNSPATREIPILTKGISEGYVAAASRASQLKTQLNRLLSKNDSTAEAIQQVRDDLTREEQRAAELAKPLPKCLLSAAAKVERPGVIIGARMNKGLSVEMKDDRAGKIQIQLYETSDDEPGYRKDLALLSCSSLFSAEQVKNSLYYETGILLQMNSKSTTYERIRLQQPVKPAKVEMGAA